MKSHDNQRIELLAYYIYIAEGRPEGRALRHWCESEYLITTDMLIDNSAGRHNGHGEDADGALRTNTSSNVILENMRADNQQPDELNAEMTKA